MTEEPVVHKPDPGRPYKAVVASVNASCVYILATQPNLPDWAKVILGALVVGLGTYVTPNPTIRRLRRR